MNDCEIPLKGVFELWERLAKEYENNPVKTYQRLTKSMPRRIEAILKAKGDHTDY